MPVFLIFGAVFAFMLASVGLLWWMFKDGVDKAEVKSGTFVSVELKSTLDDAPSEPGIFDEPGSAQPTPTEIAQALRKAAKDDRIQGLYLEIDGASASYAVWDELRSAVVDFVASGKPCVAYAPSEIGMASYYLMSACPTLLTSPAAVVLVNGMQIDVQYFRNTLTKLGIEPEYEHVGDFKSAIEAFERTSPSAPAAEAYEALLDSLYDHIVEGIAQGRSRSVAEVKAWIDHPVLPPSQALVRGMVDGLAWRASVRTRVSEAGSDGFLAQLAQPVPEDAKEAFTPVRELVKEMRSSGKQPGIAVIYASGEINVGDDAPSLFGGSNALTDGAFVKWLDEVRQDDRVKAVVLRVDSPGGSALASMNMREAILRVKRAGKPVVVSMAGYAASGGYLISADADWIVAQPTTLTGSIGVFGGKFDLSGLYDKLGLTIHSFARGEMSGLLSASHGFTEAERQVFRGYLSDFYGQFVGLVADGRGLAFDQVEHVAQGRVWTGSQALERGLVDALGGLDVALTKASELAGLDPADSPVYVWPRQLTFFERLVKVLDNSDEASMRAAVWGAVLSPAQRTRLDTLANASRHGGMLALPEGLPVVQ